MSTSGSTSGSSVSLDELTALNAEILALMRAGVPLARGLGEVGEDLPGRLGKITNIVGRRLESGQSLSDVLADRSMDFPPVYRAVVEAGMRSGRLPAALESVARSARRLGEARRIVMAGLVYPLIVFLLAWTLFVFFIASVAPRILIVYEMLSLDVGGVYALLMKLRGSAVYWGPAVPAVVLIVVGVWWFRASRASLVQPRFAGAALGWLPWMGVLLRASRVATFAEVLALLTENDVPLQEGIVLAAEATGDPRMIQSARDIAAGIERGETPQQGFSRGAGFPPLLEWLIRTGGDRDLLLSALRHAAEIYRRRADRYAEAARVYLPVALTVVIGGSITLGYALLLFVPWVRFLHALS